jgi:hypothetical protein
MRESFDPSAARGLSGCRYATLGPLIVFLCAVAGSPAGNAQPVPARIAPIGSTPDGQSYGRWAAQWWQWLLGIPVDVNPALDLTGDHCAEQQSGKVWFLAGSMEVQPVGRHCEIPADTSLFFPILNHVNFAIETDPPSTRTEAFVRSEAQCSAPVTELSAWIDDKPVANLRRYFTGLSGNASPLFHVNVPPNNIFGTQFASGRPPLYSPVAEQGYYLFVYPLSPGAHTIRWSGAGCLPDFRQQITYRLLVKPAVR